MRKRPLPPWPPVASHSTSSGSRLLSTAAASEVGAAADVVGADVVVDVGFVVVGEGVDSDDVVDEVGVWDEGDDSDLSVAL